MENTAEFSIGDVVKLKSNGPKMTVNQIDGDEITCKWFNEKTQTFEETKFNKALLFNQSQAAKGVWEGFKKL